MASTFGFLLFYSFFRVDDMSPETIEAAKKIISRKSRNDSQEEMETLMQRIKNIEQQLASVGQFDSKLDNILRKLSRWTLNIYAILMSWVLLSTYKCNYIFSSWINHFNCLIYLFEIKFKIINVQNFFWVRKLQFNPINRKH